MLTFPTLVLYSIRKYGGTFYVYLLYCECCVCNFTYIAGYRKQEVPKAEMVGFDTGVTHKPTGTVYVHVWYIAVYSVFSWYNSWHVHGVGN